MSPERWSRMEEIFQAALDLDPVARLPFISEACAGDAAMRTQIEALLSNDHEAGDFIEEPAFASAEALWALTADVRSPDEPPDSMIGRRIGPYLIEEEIGRGGMGTVYRAVRDDGSFLQEVAIKVVKRGMATDAILDRFRRERQILAMVNHPNIARLLDGGSTEDAQPYFVMELIVGATITQYCSERVINLQQRLKLFSDICAAVAHAHQNLIIHRDLKPANILVTPEGQVKLLDFGIAKFFAPELGDLLLTRQAEAVLTPEYATPEQVRNDPVTTATDVYALGLILYELLTGAKAQRLPSASLIDIERAVCQTEPRRPSEVVLTGVAHTAKKLKGDLDNIVSKAIQKDPVRRYSTVNQFAEDIARYLTGQAVLARPDSFLYRTGKFFRRNKLAVAAACITALSLIGGMAAAAWQARIAREHFNSVRSLAKSLLTEINPAIADVAGTTKARHLIVHRSLEYLDKLSRNSRRDTELMTELAEAYEAVATIQGNRNKSNLGDYDGAMTSFHKALELRERIEQIAPSPKNRQWIALIRAEAARTYPESDEAVRLARGSVEIANQLVREYPGKYNVVLANAYFGLGYIHFMREEAHEAIACFTKTREIGEAAHRSKNNLSVCDRYISANYLLLRDPGAALRHAKRGMELDELRVKEDPSPRAQMDLSYDYERVAQSLQALGHPAPALEMAQKAERMRELLAAGDHADQRTATALADIHEVLGSIFGDLRRRRESLDYLEKAIEARKRFVQAASQSADDRWELARVYATASAAYSRFGLCQQFNAFLDQARTVFTAQKRKLSLEALDRSPVCYQRVNLAK
jgi:tetratricopeptide (TPR) repeat protein